jgi:glycosyltransferase involved in cell wall biosynthesis
LTHKNHPCAVWARNSLSNWKWLKESTLALYKEYQFRYNKIHKSGELTKTLPEPQLIDIGITTRPQAMPEQYRNADCVVLPSYREGLPRVMLEAISMAKPIITTDAPGCRDTVVDGENGFMVPIRDSEALYNAMKKIISCDTETLKKMGLKGRELALNEFDEAIVFEKYIDLVKILIQ